MGFPSTVGKGLGGGCRAEQSLSQILFQFSVCQWCVLGHFGTLLDINIHYYFFVHLQTQAIRRVISEN